MLTVIGWVFFRVKNVSDLWPLLGELLSRISVNPNVCFGKPCIRGHRIWVSLILDLLAGGMTVREILDAYPGLKDTDIQACIAYAAEVARERVVDIPVEAAP